MAKNDENESSISSGQALQDNGIYVFMDEVSAETIQPIVEWILYENYVSKQKKKELLLMVCSDGGDLQPAFALIDVIRSSNIPIKTIGLGQIGSSGLLIFMTGAKGRRILTPNTSILSHQFSWSNEGKAHELFAAVREFELTEQRMIEHYRNCTGADDATIREYLLPAQDRWLSAEEAIKLGVCDLIGGHHSAIQKSVTPTPTKTTRKLK